jgi:hypothetical protein
MMRAPRQVPLPQPDAVSGPFWVGCGEQRLLFQQCRACGTFQSVPRLCCANCRAGEFDWIESGGKGRVYTYTIVHHPPSPALKDEVPFVVIVVKLDDCGGVLLISNLVGEGALEVAVDRAVRLCWDDGAGASLPRFELA